MIITTYKDIKGEFQIVLDKIYSSREVDAIFYVLIDFLKQWTKVDYTLNKNEVASNEDFQFLMNSLKTIAKGSPVQHITNRVDFYDMHLFVNENVLVPRPETEELVHLVHTQNKIKHPASIVDIGTGSGCIAISIAKNSNANITAIDNSIEALEIAKSNAILNSVEINFELSDVFNFSDTKKYDLIVSNPPYVLESEKKLMNKNVLDYEPHNALFVSDNDPLIYYKEIAKIATNNLNKNGLLFFEINEKYSKQIIELLSNLNFVDIELKKDINGRDRIIKSVFK